MVSHLTAATLWGLYDTWPALIDVTVPCEAGRKIDEIRCRRCRYPNPEEVTIREEVACTTPARTLVDVTGVLGIASLRKIVGRAGVLRLLDFDAIDLALHNAKGRRGLRKVEKAIAPWRAEPDARPDVRSDFEALMLPSLVELGFSRPILNAPIRAGGRTFLADFLWQDARVIVETDGRATHETPVAFQDDRLRDQHLVAAGYRVLRVTWSQIHAERHSVVTRIAQVLDSSST